MEQESLALFRMGCSWMGKDKKATLPKICHIYSAIMKLGMGLSELNKTEEVFKLLDTPLEL